MADIDVEPGDKVVTWTGLILDEPGRETVVDKVTKTQIVAGGSRWYRQSGYRIGDSGFRRPRLYRADDPKLAEAAAKRAAHAERSTLEIRLSNAAHWWRRDPASENTKQLRAAITEIAPHLGITVIDPATSCQYTVPDAATPDRGRCLLPASHADTGEWHAGIGWTASLAPTTGEDR